MKKFTFHLSDGRALTVESPNQPTAIEMLKKQHGDSIKHETVIGLDVRSPKFWIKRGTVYYPISATAAAVASH